MRSSIPSMENATTDCELGTDTRATSSWEVAGTVSMQVADYYGQAGRMMR